MSKKIIMGVSAVVIIVVLAFLCGRLWEEYETSREEYFYKINSVIKEYDFDTARAKDGKIILYNSDGEITAKLPFEDYKKNMDFIYARKDGAVIYFIISAAVDDERGIMFVNDGSDGILDGIHSLTRVGGNAYRYSTN